MNRIALAAFALVACSTAPTAENAATKPSLSSCRLAVIQGSPGQGSGPQTPGFLTIPGDQFIPAADADGGLFYDRALKRWIPAGPQSLTPDGRHYIYADHVGSTSTFHVVDLAADADRVVGPPGLWVGAGVDDNALYAMRVEFIESQAYGTTEKSLGLWKLPLDGSAPVQLTSDSRRWTWAAAGGVYGDITTGDVAGAPNDIARFDLSTQKFEVLYEPGARARLLAVDEKGTAFVLTESGDEQLWRVSGPNAAIKIWAGTSDGIRPEGPVAVDGSEVWFSSSSMRTTWAIFHYSPRNGLEQMATFSDRPVSVAGPCT